MKGRQDRPIRLDAFMARANAAYYATHDPFADFTTSPEITQVFGEVLGLWAAVAWGMLGRPSPVLLVEAGPGRGTLMADALRAVARAAPDFRAALSVHLIETSPRLRALQREHVPDAVWHRGLATLPEGPLLLLANEFLDALPIRQFVRRGGEWRELHVIRCGEAGLSTAADQRDRVGKRTDRSAEGAGAAAYRWHEVGVATRRRPSPVALPQGDGEMKLEVCEPARSFVARLAARLVRHPGAALFLDYGPGHSMPGHSLQAIARGRVADPLSPPGTADLTAHVDFASLAAIACSAGATVIGPIPQGVFLARLGLFQRTGRLAQDQPPVRAAALIDAAQRLAEPHRMGRLFQAMAISSPGTGVLPGFEP